MEASTRTSRGSTGGADDDLTKPIEVAELEARIRAQLRRSASQAGAVVRCGDVAFDTVDRTVALNGAGRPVGKAALAEALFGFEETNPSAVEVHVHRLRENLESSAWPCGTRTAWCR